MANGMRRALNALTYVAVLCVTVGTSSHAKTMGEIMSGSRDSVAQVLAAECGMERNRVGTGFLWRDGRTLVTARHVVAGCNRVTALFTASGRSSRATPTRELRAQDLVLLKLDRGQPAPPLEASADLPDVDTTLLTLGYAYGMPTLDSKKLDVTLANAPPGSSLRDMLDDGLRRKLRESGEIDIATRIIRLDGNLLPGLSGAPLIGEDGRVYGIGSGGLQQGAGGVVWAVRAEYLAALATSSPIERVAVSSGTSDLPFAYQQPQDQVASVRCGGLELVRSGRLPLSKLYDTSDDRLGLQQLTAVLGVGGSDIDTLQFEVWNDPASGAAVAVPAGTAIESSEEVSACEARVNDGTALLIMATDVDGSGQDAQAASLSFEREVGEYVSRPLLMQDPQFTYPFPNQRPDGFVVRRLAYNLAAPGPVLGSMNADYVFISHLLRGKKYVGVAAVRRNMTVDTQLMQFCQFNALHPDCVAGRESFRPWNVVALAAHLATMPPI